MITGKEIKGITPQSPYVQRKLPKVHSITVGDGVVRFKASNATTCKIVDRTGGIVASVASSQGFARYPLGTVPEYILAIGPSGTTRWKIHP